MKISFFLTAFCLIFLSVFLVWTKFEANNHDIAISVNENANSYTFSAAYNASKTVEVLRYINRCIKPGGQLEPGRNYFDITTGRIDVTTRPDDKMEFYIKESPGKLKVKLDKGKNSTASYHRIKRMCEGIKGLLTINKSNKKI